MTEQKSVKAYLHELGLTARQASSVLSMASTAQKNQALNAIAVRLLENQPALLDANAKDMHKGREKNLDSALLDR